MADPVGIVSSTASIVKAIIDLALKIKNQVETFRHNREDCRKISELVGTVRAVAKGLRKTTEKEDDGALLGGALKALKQALERAWDLVVACQKKNAVLRALDAEGIAVKLRRVYLDVSLNLSAVVLANGAYNTSKLADIKGIVAALRAEVAYNTRMLAKISEIVAALPEHLRQEVARLVESYSDSTDDDVSSSYQNGSSRGTNKTDTDGVVSYCQNKSTRETKAAETEKINDVASYHQNKSTRETKAAETEKLDDVDNSTDDDATYYPNRSKRKTKKAEMKKTSFPGPATNIYSSSYADNPYYGGAVAGSLDRGVGINSFGYYGSGPQHGEHVVGERVRTLFGIRAPVWEVAHAAELEKEGGGRGQRAGGAAVDTAVVAVRPAVSSAAAGWPVSMGRRRERTPASGGGSRAGEVEPATPRAAAAKPWSVG